MALRIEKPGRREKYSLEADRESSQPTVFELRPLTWEEMAEVNEHAPMTQEQAVKVAAIVAPTRAEKRDLSPDEIARIAEVAPMDAAYTRRSTKQAAIAVRYGVTGIRGLLDSDGNPQDMSSVEFAKSAPASVLRELGGQIIRLSRLEETLIKK